MPRTSSIGAAAAATSRPNSAATGSATSARDSQSSSAARNASASRARSGVGPAEPMPVPTDRCSGCRASPNAATAITIALRVPILLNCCGPVAHGIQTAVTSSSGRPACFLGPV